MRTSLGVGYHADYYQKNKERIKERNLKKWEENKSKDYPMEQTCSTCGESKPIKAFTFLKRKFKYELQCSRCKYETSKKRAKKLLVLGLCVSCSKPREDLDKKYCTTCGKKYAKKKKEGRLGVKVEAINFLGGKCVRCGLVEDIPDVYDFHHQSGEKEINIGQLITNKSSLDKVQGELSKCILLCANCHRIIHWEMNNKE